MSLLGMKKKKKFEVEKDYSEFEKYVINETGLNLTGQRVGKLKKTQREVNPEGDTVIIGAGVIGLSTAYYLAKAGRKNIVVVDRAAHPAAETSAYNAGQVGKLFGVLTSKSTPFSAIKGMFRPASQGYPYFNIKWMQFFNPVFLRFLKTFLYNCFFADQIVKRRSAYKSQLTIQSKQLRQEVIRDIKIDPSTIYLQNGSINVYPDAASLKAAELQMEAEGAKFEKCNHDRLIQLEPCIQHFKEEIAGGLYFPEDTIADCRLFTHALADYLKKHHGVRFLMNTSIERLECNVPPTLPPRSSKFMKKPHHDVPIITHAVTTDGQKLKGTDFVVAAGIHSHKLLATSFPFFKKVPMFPMKGYTVLMPFQNDTIQPRRLIVTEKHKMWSAHYGSFVRHVSIGELDDKNGVTPKILKKFVNTILRQYPAPTKATVDYNDPQLPPNTFAPCEIPGVDVPEGTQVWTGLRPLVADDMMIVGSTAHVQNLFLNTGHGGFGWAFSFVSGHLCANSMVQTTTELSPVDDLYMVSIDRFIRST